MDIIYKLYGKYFEQYKTKVLTQIRGLIRTTDEEIMDVCLTELNNLFEIISGRKTSIIHIPKYNRFPDSVEFNNMLSNLDIDFSKLFDLTKIISNDIQSVVNYNSVERDSIIELLSSTQAAVYNAYISSKKGINGTTIIKENFINDDNTSIKTGVIINPSLKRLMLKPINDNTKFNRKDINIDFIDATHYIEQPTDYNLYPNNIELSLGSYWKVSDSKTHHGGINYNPNYRNNILTDKTGTSGEQLGSCQFESVITIDPDNKIPMNIKIENEYSEYKSIPTNYIFINRPTSINDKYIYTKQLDSNLPSNIRFKIPITTNTLVNSCIIKINPTGNNTYPKINEATSFVRTDVNNEVDSSNKIGISVISNDTLEYTDNVSKIYTIIFATPVKPTMLELEFVYNNNDGWYDVTYDMSVWLAELTKIVNINHKLDNTNVENDQLLIEYNRQVYVMIDDIADNDTEKNKVLDIITFEGVK